MPSGDSFPLLILKGHIHRDLGNREETKQAFAAALALDPTTDKVFQIP
jgi:hypothetical protein